ncbi:MAG: hypothetical protein RSB25_07455 [Acinetobacter sp.]
MNEDLQSKFRLLILDLLGLPDGYVRSADITQPTEGDRYIIVQFNIVNPVGQHGTTHENNIQTVYQNSEITVTLDFFGHDAFTLASTLPNAFRSSVGTYGLDEIGLGFLKANEARNLSALELDRITRYQANYLFSVVSNFSSPLSTLDTVSIGIQVDRNF